MLILTRQPTPEPENVDVENIHAESQDGKSGRQP